MQVTPKDGNSNSAPQSSGPSARDRAMAALLGNQSTQAAPPVQNPNQVAPEEMGAIKTTESVDENRQTDTIEASTSESSAPEAPKSATKEEASLSSQYAQLARKEKALRAKALADQQALKSREAEIRASVEAEVKARLESEYQSKYIPKDKFTQDTWQALLDAGISYEKITELALNQPQELHPQVKASLEALKAEIKATREAQDELRRAAQDQEKNQYTQAVNQIRNEVKSLVKTGDDYETIREYGQEDEVVKLIEKTFSEDGVLLSVEEAASEVENYLMESLMKATKLKKIQNKLKSPESAPQETTQKQVQNAQPQKTPTLTNQISTQRKLSARERAILAMRGELK